MNGLDSDLVAIRSSLAALEPSPRVEPNETIPVDRAFFPLGHRGVLDLRRQLVVGNRGMGKSFWSHALLNREVRRRLAKVYGYPLFDTAEVMIGFNGSAKVSETAPTIDEITGLLGAGVTPEQIWRAVLTRVASRTINPNYDAPLSKVIDDLEKDLNLYSVKLSEADEYLVQKNSTLLVVFDALDRLGRDWNSIRKLTRALLGVAVSLQSFSAIRSKIFMRTDLFNDEELFRFPDSSKIKNDYVDLIWRPIELYGLLLFELLRADSSREPLKRLAERESATDGLPGGGLDKMFSVDAQNRLISGIAGEFMGTDKKRGRVYTWVPLHLSDAASACSPRSFLIAWKKAAEHQPTPSGLVIDHLGLQDGVRWASRSRLTELYEDYPWIKPALAALRRQFVPMEKEQLLKLWDEQDVIQDIQKDAQSETMSTPVKFLSEDQPSALLSSMRDVGVMEVRGNGKINVPDIYRVEAGILRRGGVAVPKKPG